MGSHAMLSEHDKMMAGELYRAFDPELETMRQRAHGLVSRLNDLPSGSQSARQGILLELLGAAPADAPPYIEPKFRCDYGSNISVGRHFYANFDCCILDCNRVTIGDNVFFAPGVQIYTAGHPVDPKLRGNYLNGLEFAKPVNIGNDVWIGGNAIVLPGVSIGDAVTVGAGSVVTKDVPDRVVVAGNPARIIRWIENSPTSTQTAINR